MAFIQRSTPTTQKDFSASAFIKSAQRKKTKSTQPAEQFFWTCFYREENKYYDIIAAKFNEYQEEWHKITGKTEKQKQLLVCHNLVTNYQVRVDHIIEYIKISNHKNRFHESTYRVIDVTKEEIWDIIRQTHTQQRRNIEMQTDFHTQSQMNVSLERKKNIQAWLESQVIWVKWIRYDQRDILLLNLEFSKVKWRNPRNIQELKEYLEFDSYPLNLLEYIRIEGHPPLNREILNKFIEQRKK